jgi:hypothetical protein
MFRDATLCFAACVANAVYGCGEIKRSVEDDRIRLKLDTLESQADGR